ncbi:hypothetical protein BC834DRAFT_313131 [Gloeopeniophorella convolvens]|nr:hypothetical protein BC834DRAFT_313131 [Gloeopeniophorella convolvens]
MVSICGNPRKRVPTPAQDLPVTPHIYTEQRLAMACLSLCLMDTKEGQKSQGWPSGELFPESHVRRAPDAADPRDNPDNGGLTGMEGQFKTDGPFQEVRGSHLPESSSGQERILPTFRKRLRISGRASADPRVRCVRDPSHHTCASKRIAGIGTRSQVPRGAC